MIKMGTRAGGKGGGVVGAPSNADSRGHRQLRILDAVFIMHDRWRSRRLADATCSKNMQPYKLLFPSKLCQPLFAPLPMFARENYFLRRPSREQPNATSKAHTPLSTCPTAAQVLATEEEHT